MVNNGRALYGQFAALSSKNEVRRTSRAIVDTCFLRPWCTQHAPPCRWMRKQEKSGHIFQVSSDRWPPAAVRFPGNTPFIQRGQVGGWGGFFQRLPGDWKIKSRPSESRSAHWSREAFGPTGHGGRRVGNAPDLLHEVRGNGLV